MEQRTRDKPKQSVKAIIGDGDNWVRYQEAYAGKVTEDQIKEVEKMLGCGGVAKWIQHLHLSGLWGTSEGGV